MACGLGPAALPGCAAGGDRARQLATLSKCSLSNLPPFPILPFTFLVFIFILCCFSSLGTLTGTWHSSCLTAFQIGSQLSFLACHAPLLSLSLITFPLSKHFPFLPTYPFLHLENFFLFFWCRVSCTPLSVAIKGLNC